MDARIAIVGAGISGLSAGYRLMRAGLNPIIFEKESRVGGRISSENVDGFIIDRSAYTIPQFHRNFIGLLGELGLEPSLVETPGSSSTFKQGKAHRIRIGSPADFLKYRLLSLSSKKDLVRLFLYARSLGKALNLASPTETTLDLDQETTAEFLRREYGDEILEHIAYPIFAELFLGVPEKNSKVAFLATLPHLTRFKILCLDQGMGVAAERLGQLLDVRLSVPVLKVRPMGKAGPYEVCVGGKNPASAAFDFVIVAVPAPIVPDLIDELPEALEEALRGVAYTPSIVTALALSDPDRGGSMINNLLRDEFRVLATVVRDHHKSPSRVPAGKGLMTAILSESASRDLFAESDGVITRHVIEEMDRLFSGFSERLMFSRVYRWKHAAPQLPPGMLLRQQRIRDALEAGSDRLYLASDGLHMASIDVSVSTGFRAADRVIEKLQQGHT